MFIRSLLIEPNPAVYSKLIENRPNAHRIGYAASCSEDSQNQTAGFWMSEFTNAAQDDSVNRAAYAYHPDAKFVHVPCGSLTPVLLDVFSSNKRVHFFSLDTEGTEHMVLQNLDFGKIFVDILIAENRNNFCKETCEARDKTRAIMKANGFLLYSDVIWRSDLYVSKDSEFAQFAPENRLSV